MHSERNDQNLKLSPTVLKYAPAIALFGYAYLYLLGYLYLFFYFTRWGLNVNEMGYSIVDYATVAMYPNLQIAVISSVFFIFGLVLAYPIIKMKYHQRPINIKNPIMWIIITPMVFGIVGIITREYLLYKIYFLGAISIPLYIGFEMGLYRRIKWPGFRTIIFCTFTLYFIILLVFSGISGTMNAQIYRDDYSFYFLSLPPELNEVIVFSNKPLSGMDIYQTAPNRYEGLFLLAFKQDIYYLVPNIGRHDQFYSQSGALQGEIDLLIKEVNEINAIADQSLKGADVINSELDNIISEIETLIQKAESRTLGSPERMAEISAAKAKIAEFYEARKKRESIKGSVTKLSEQSKKKLDDASDRLKAVKSLRDNQSMITRGTYSVKKEEISHIIYIYDKYKSEGENKKGRK